MKHQPQSLLKSPNKKPKYNPEHMDPTPTLATPKKSNQQITEYYDIVAREKTWMNQRKIDKLGEELVQWALSNPEATKLSKFFKARGIDTPTAYLFAQEYPSFKRDYIAAKEIVGDRREDGGLQRLYDASIVKFTMSLYDDEWKRETERLSKLTKDESKLASSQAINVIMQRFTPDNASIENSNPKENDEKL